LFTCIFLCFSIWKFLLCVFCYLCWSNTLKNILIDVTRNVIYYEEHFLYYNFGNKRVLLYSMFYLTSIYHLFDFYYFTLPSTKNISNSYILLYPLFLKHKSLSLKSSNDYIIKSIYLFTTYSPNISYHLS